MNEKAPRTNQPIIELPRSIDIARLTIAYLSGITIALLLARLILRLFAVRPDQPVIRLLLAYTAPLTAPLAFLDIGQPQFGATFEYSTLISIPLIFLIGLATWSSITSLSNAIAKRKT